MSLITVNWNPHRRQLRQFGAIGAIALGLIGAIVYFRHVLFGVPLAAETAHIVAILLIAFGAACGLAALIAPAALLPLYVALTILSLPVGIVVSHVVMAILFFGVITPIGLIMRLTGRDALQREFRHDLMTYWEPRPTTTNPRRYFRQS